MSREIVSVLEHDPDLGEGIDRQRLADAVQRARAAVLVLGRGEWPAADWPETVRHGVGLLVLDGLLLREVALHHRVGAELLGAGDLVRPWQAEDGAASLPRRPMWQVIQRTRLAVLDVQFTRRLRDHPEILGQLAGRALRRARYLAVNMAIVHQPKVETRVLMVLWDMADRWGSTRRDGVFLPLRLTHEILAALVAARRPTVSVALRSLEEAGVVTRSPDGWLLHGDPPHELGEIDAAGH